MKHIWVVESSGGRKWNVAQDILFFKRKHATAQMNHLAGFSPGLQWRVVKYERVK
jgi:hypothetical protein